MDDERPLWLPIAMFVAWMVFFAKMPHAWDEPNAVVLFKDISYGWLAIASSVMLFLTWIGFRGWEWGEFGDDERRAFLRVMAVMAVVIFGSWYGVTLLAASLGWHYDLALWVTVAPALVVALVVRLRKKRYRSWD